jgi:multiple sugar transport system substrate-binding protein
MVQWKTACIIVSLGVAVSATLSAPHAMAADAAPEPVHLRFTFWGSAFEKKDITAAIDTFNATHPGIKVEGQHIPNSGYVEKISTQLAAGDPPDIAYLDETQAFPWAAEGKLLDLTPYFDGQPERTLVKNIVYRAGDHLIGTGLATGAILTYYNKDIFDKERVKELALSLGL